MSNRWTTFEIEMLERVYPYYGWGAISLLIPNKTYFAIKSKANKLKVKREVRIPKRRIDEWPIKYENKLKKMYPKATWKRLLKSFPNYSRNAIYQKAHRLHIKRTVNYLPKVYNNWTKQEYSLLKKLYPEKSWKVIMEALPGRAKKSISVRASKLNIKKRYEMKPHDNYWTKEETKILKNNYVKGEYGKLDWIKLEQLLPNRTRIAMVHKASRIFQTHHYELTINELTGISKKQEMSIRRKYKLSKEEFLIRFQKQYDKLLVDEIIEEISENPGIGLKFMREIFNLKK